MPVESTQPDPASDKQTENLGTAARQQHDTVSSSSRDEPTPAKAKGAWGHRVSRDSAAGNMGRVK